MDQKGKVALITGASSGIGMELAKIHAKRGGDLVLVARRKERLIKLKGELESEHGVSVQVIVKDLSHPDGAKEVYDETLSHVDYLINNAGFGFSGFFHEVPWKKSQEMINLNISSLACLTNLFLKDMHKRNSGKILNVSSIAAFFPGPLNPVYAATKSFELSFSQAIANELSGTNITVSVLCPGPVDTEFAEVAGMTYERIKLLRKSRIATAEETAQAGYEGMLKGKHVIIPKFTNKLLVTLARILPRDAATWVSRKVLEDFRL